MAQNKKPKKTTFNSLCEWKEAYIPTASKPQTLEEQYADDPKGLGAALAMQSIRNVNKGTGHQHKTS